MRCFIDYFLLMNYYLVYYDYIVENDLLNFRGK